MLQRHIPGGEASQQQGSGQPSEDLPAEQRAEPAAIDRDDQQPGGQFSAP
ncbi:hypothetical protein FHW04_003398 [Pantoea sp. AN62]